MQGFASIEARLIWQSEGVKHTDGFFIPKLNFWRDFIPQPLEAQLQQKGIGELCSAKFAAGELLPEQQKSRLVKIRQSQFARNYLKMKSVEPRLGRFYPSGMLSGVDGIFKESRLPVRCVAIDEQFLQFDLNHPLAGKAVQLDLIMHSHNAETTDQRGGRCLDVAETAAENGPGMQARRDVAAEFFADDPFMRLDPRTDDAFYKEARMVNHIDSTALEQVRKLYGNLLKPDMQILDLMSSWTSHLPEDLALSQVVGLGMNQEELQANSRLTEQVLHDLNAQPSLPFADESFDAIICSLSVEYLINPFAVFAELARILKPGGVLIHTFSNRWFPSKAIQIWADLHEFERLGLVLEYFSRSGRFKNLETYSMRNLPRPEDDKYYGVNLMTADPVFAVWGQRV